MKNVVRTAKQWLPKKAGTRLLVCLLLLCNIANAQPGYGFKDIPLVYNLDSMEAAIPKFNKQTVAYIKHLIAIENSRIAFRSYKDGEYTKEIDSLSTALQFPFGNAFAAYLLAKTMVIYSFTELKNPMLSGGRAVGIFTTLKDTAGVITTQLFYALCCANYLRFIVNRNVSDISFNNRQDLIRSYRDSIQLYLSKASLAIKKSDTVNMVNFLHTKAYIIFRIDTGKTALNNIGPLLDSAIQLAESTHKLHFRLSAFYSFYGKVLEKNNDPVAAINFYKKAVQCIPHKESNLNYSVYYDIGTTYYSIGKKDSSIRYHLLSLNKLKEVKDVDVGAEMENHDALAAIYSEQKNYKAAYEQALLSNEGLLAIDAENLKAQLNNYEDNQKIKTQELQAQILKAQKKQANQVMWFAIAILGLLGFVIAYIIVANRKLQTANTQIKALQQSREKFYSIVAHDLRSPINSYQSMAGTVSFLLQQKNYTQIEKIAQRIDDTGIKLKSMLQNLLQWSLAEHGDLAFHPLECEVKKLLEEIVPVYIEIAATRNITIIQDYQYQKSLFTDPNYLATIVRNLLDNAIKSALPASAVHLSTFEDYGKFNLAVTNQSAASPAKLNDIQKLFKAGTDWQPGENGMGLGLILVQDFTKKMNGTMDVQYRDGVVCFWLQVPVS